MKLRSIFVIMILMTLFVMPVLAWDFMKSTQKQAFVGPYSFQPVYQNPPVSGFTLHNGEITNTSIITKPIKKFSLSNIAKQQTNFSIADILKNSTFKAISTINLIEQEVNDIPYVFFDDKSGLAGKISDKKTYGDTVLSTKKEISREVEPVNSIVREYAVSIAKKSPGKYNIGQICAIFDEGYSNYVFSWDDIPGKNNGRLIEFLARKFDIDWVKNAEIEKIDNDKTIRVSNEKKSLSLKINDKKTEVILEIDDGRTSKFEAKMENDKLNIYYINWAYVSDPRGDGYYSPPSESLDVCKDGSCIGAGDCDDFAILMSALIEAIGGTTRIIIAENTTERKAHAYTEVYLGRLDTQKNQVEDLIHWLMNENKMDSIYTHINIDTEEVWLNLDWSENHPGGPFFPSDNYYVLYVHENRTRNPPNAPNFNAVFRPLSYAEIWTDVGRNLINQSYFKKAINCLDKAIKKDSKYSPAWNYKGNALSDLSKYDDAIKCYDEAIRLDLNYAKAWSNKGNALVKQGKYDEAIKAHNMAIKLDPNYAEARNNKGVALDCKGKYGEAIKAYDEAIELNPSLAAAWNNKGAALDGQGKYSEAIKAYDEAIRLDPNLAKAWNNKGNALKALGRTNEANAVFAKAKEVGE